MAGGLPNWLSYAFILPFSRFLVGVLWAISFRHRLGHYGIGCRVGVGCGLLVPVDARLHHGRGIRYCRRIRQFFDGVDRVVACILEQLQVIGWQGHGLHPSLAPEELAPAVAGFCQPGWDFPHHILRYSDVHGYRRRGCPGVCRLF